MSKKRLREKAALTIRAEIRESGGKRHIVGVIPYDSPSELMWGDTTEVIRAGAFTKTLKESKDIVALVNHSTDAVLGRTRNGGLVLTDSPEGLVADVEVPPTTAGNDAFELVSRDIAPGLSFGFAAVKEKATKNEDGTYLRELLEVRLFEVSFAVPFPAYPETDSIAAVRSVFERREIDLGDLTTVLSKESIDEADKPLVRSVIEKLSGLIGAEPQREPEPESTPPAPPDYAELLLELT
jgi:HK97 family phage prohead protease